MQRSPRLFSALYPGSILLPIATSEVLRDRLPFGLATSTILRTLIGTAVMFAIIWALMPSRPFSWSQLFDPRSIRWWGVGCIVGGGLTYAFASGDLRGIGGGIAGLGLCYLPLSWAVAHWPGMKQA